MSRSNVLLWTLVILVAGAIIWLAMTGRLQALAEQIADAYLNFVKNIVPNLRR